MEIFVEVTVKGKKIIPGNVTIRSVVLMKDKSREQVKGQIIEALTNNSEAFVDAHIPGKFGKGEKYVAIFAYSILDKFKVETNTWTNAEASINLMRVESMDTKPLIQVANNLS